MVANCSSSCSSGSCGPGCRGSRRLCYQWTWRSNQVGGLWWRKQAPEGPSKQQSAVWHSLCVVQLFLGDVRAFALRSSLPGPAPLPHLTLPQAACYAAHLPGLPGGAPHLAHSPASATSPLPPASLTAAEHTMQPAGLAWLFLWGGGPSIPPRASAAATAACQRQAWAALQRLLATLADTLAAVGRQGGHAEIVISVEVERRARSAPRRALPLRAAAGGGAWAMEGAGQAQEEEEEGGPWANTHSQPPRSLLMGVPQPLTSWGALLARPGLSAFTLLAAAAALVSLTALALLITWA